MELKLTTIKKDVNVDRAIKDIQSLGTRSPFIQSDFLHKTLPVVFSVSQFDKKLYLDSIMTLENDRGQGHASVVLKQILNIADRYGVDCYINPEPFGRGGLSASKLKAWYKRHGFGKHPYDVDGMVYRAK